MFEYELHLARRDELQRTAEEWRLAQQAKAAQAPHRTPARRAPRRYARTLRPHGA